MSDITFYSEYDVLKPDLQAQISRQGNYRNSRW